MAASYIESRNGARKTGREESMKLLREYAKEVKSVSGAGVPETSYYPALSNLLNKVGDELKPKVSCVINPKNQGAGIPDGGLFTPDQLSPNQGIQIAQGPIPTRGALEVKGAGEEIDKIISGTQISKYLSRYKQVLVTNLREFALVREDPSGQPVKLETYEIAATEADFWKAAGDPSRLAADHGQRVEDYLKRVMLYAAPLAEPKDVAWFLASYAQEARKRIEGATNIPDLSSLRSALEGALGIEFQGEEGEALFRSTLVQTLFYGVFSAWVLWCNSSSRSGSSEFDWRTAQHHLRVPIISTLFSQIATSRNLRKLGLDELLDWTTEALNRVDQGAFFTRFKTDEAVQYFYEPFLEAYDPELRKRYGVWYTPQEIVHYMVERVDTALREELGIEEGLAADNVYVLDPAAGTGSYVLEVLKRIQKTLNSQGQGALTAHRMKKAAQERVFGFEVLPAPFVVSHLQIGLMLQNLGVALGEHSDERAAVYLTNSLTGWEPMRGAKVQLPFPEFEQERDAAQEVKQEKPILVILGNPPYDAFAGVSPDEEEGLVEPYKEGLFSEYGIRRPNLDDLYVRFLRLAERRIAEGEPGKGVVCYISNFSYLSGASFPVMRKHLLGSFDRIWIDSLNGDSRETGKKTPWGTPDPSIFSTSQNKAGIRVGTAVSLFVRNAEEKGKGEHAGSLDREQTIRYRQFWGTNKRQELLDSLNSSDFDSQYDFASPRKENRYSLRPSNAGADYLSWPNPKELSKVGQFNGPIERRGQAFISIERESLASRVSAYLDKSVSDSQVESIYSSLMMTGNRIVGPDARKKVQSRFSYEDAKIVRYPFKPLDMRYCYLENLRPVFSEPSPQLLDQRFPGNEFFVTRDAADKAREGPPFYFSPLVCDYHSLSGEARHFPKYVLDPPKLKHADGQHELSEDIEREEEHSEQKPVANLSPRARDYLSSLGMPNPDSDEQSASSIWTHALAIGFSPQYLEENSDGVRDDWPRIPLPDSQTTLSSSAALGREIAGLLDVDSRVSDAKVAPLLSELKDIAVVSKVGGGNLNPNDGELEVRAGWGYKTRKNVVMPAGGQRNKRNYTHDEMKAVNDIAASLALSETEILNLLGDETYDVYLNDATYLCNVPANVWDYMLGGYQVLKKWLSYREYDVLGRQLEVSEIEEAVSIARRTAALVSLQSALNANYETVKASLYTWPALT